MGKEEKDLFVEMMKKTGQDPKAIAECIKHLLLQDKIIKAPKKQNDGDESVIECTKDILRSL